MQTSDLAAAVVGERPAQQSRAIRSVSPRPSVAGHVPSCGVIGPEGVLDRAEGPPRGDGTQERSRDPGSCSLRVIGEPRGSGPWGWLFGGDHVFLDDLVVGGRVRAP